MQQEYEEQQQRYEQEQAEREDFEDRMQREYRWKQNYTTYVCVLYACSKGMNLLNLDAPAVYVSGALRKAFDYERNDMH